MNDEWWKILDLYNYYLLWFTIVDSNNSYIINYSLYIIH